MDVKDPNTETDLPTPEERLEELFQNLWDKVREAGETIASLRSEREDLRQKLNRAETDLHLAQKELAGQKKELVDRETRIHTIEQEAARNKGKILSNGEKEALVARAKELLARIEGYL